MYRAKRQQAAEPRRAIILLIVLVMLSLFAVIGISFWLLSDAEANSARMFVDTIDIGRNVEDPSAIAGADPTTVSSEILSQLLWGVADDTNGVQSAIRGHDLGRTMYGYNYLVGQNPLGPTFDPRSFLGQQSQNPNFISFNGTGRLHTSPPAPIANLIPDDYYLVNYQYFQQDNFVRDPERGQRVTAWANTPPPPAGANLLQYLQPAPYTGGANAPYTYPDINNMALAAVMADGRVLAQSFHRPWLFNAPDSGGQMRGLDPGNPHWTDQIGKYLTLRPRPIDMGPGFPYPEDGGGDVKNLTFSPGFLDPLTGKLCNNDSIWMDAGLPVLQLKSGKKFKPLIAVLAMDLDNRVNVNVHGNMRGIVQLNQNQQQFVHASNQGISRTEVSLASVLNQGGGTEWLNLFIGNPSLSPSVAGRYGLVQTIQGKTAYPQPVGANGNSQLNGTNEYPRFYAQADADAVQWQYTGGPPTIQNQALVPQTAFQLPAIAGGQNPNPPHFPFPYFDPASYGNGDKNELTNHPLLYNYFTPFSDPKLPTVNFNNRFEDSFDLNAGPYPEQSMESLLRYGCKGVPKNTRLLSLLPQNLAASSKTDPTVAATSYKKRHLITTLSYGLERPAVAPWILNPAQTDNPATDPSVYTYNPNQTLSMSGPQRPTPYPTGSPVPFPSTSSRGAATPGRSGEFNTNDWRNIEAILTKVDLNRMLSGVSLPDYPTVDQTTGQIDMTQQANQIQFATATAARQQLAGDIFVRMVFVTTGMYLNPNDQQGSDPFPPTSSQRYAAIRWLAQLAVNIVDYLDPDDIITPFQFDWQKTSQTAPLNYGYVFGTELPRLLVNEAYVEIDNDPNDSGLKGIPKVASRYLANFWVELLNPFQAVNPSSPNATTGVEGTFVDNGNARLMTRQLGSSPAYAVYQVILGPSDSNFNLRAPSNVRGSPTTSTKWAIVQNYAPDPAAPTQPPPGLDVTIVQPNNMQYMGPNGGNNGFYVLGAPIQFPNIKPSGTNTDPALPTATLCPINNALKPDPDDPSGTSTKYTNQMVVTFGFNSPQGLTSLPDLSNPATLPKFSVVLRRLACPGITVQTDPTTATLQNPFNPYVTVDYMDNIVPNVGVTIDNTPTGGKQPVTNLPVPQRASYGRPQPYAGDSSFGVPTTPFGPALYAGGTDTSTQTLLKMQASNTGTTAGSVTALVSMPQNTFFRQNLDLATITNLQLGNTVGQVPNQPPLTAPPGYPAFDWLTHLDRQLISPVELLQVSGYRPHELTQQFEISNNGIPAKFQHLVNWFDESNRLYRMFEFFETHDVASGGCQGGRIPGKININTIYDPETFLALCDPQAANNFTIPQISGMFTGMATLRTPQLYAQVNGQPAPQLSGNDQPFLGVAPGVSPGNVGGNTDPLYPNGGGIRNTIFRSASQAGNTAVDPTNPTAPAPRLFEPPVPTNNNHPYNRYQLLNKIFNNITTRSNVFAVWMTIGYFEVTDDTTLPVKLGAELGKAQGTNVRHHIFAIVDRSAMTVDLTQPQGNGYLGTPGQRPILLPIHGGVPAPAQTATLGLEVPGGRYEGTLWGNVANSKLPIGPGTLLLIDIGANEEVVQVTSGVTAPNPNATTPLAQQYYTFTVQSLSGQPLRVHQDPVTMTFPQGKLGNPGPQPLTGPTAPVPWNYPVVPYYKQID